MRDDVLHNITGSFAILGGVWLKGRSELLEDMQWL